MVSSKYKTLIMLKSLIRLAIIICLIYLWVLNPIPFILFEDTLQNQNQSIPHSQQIMSICSGAFDKKDNPSKISKSMLEKYFPDWTKRINYQNQQFKFLQSGGRKIREANRLRFTESQKLKLLTPQEKDAFNYFRGTGIYKSYQDVNTPPNIFDTRDTFLKKMQNFEMLTISENNSTVD